MTIELDENVGKPAQSRNLSFRKKALFLVITAAAIILSFEGLFRIWLLISGTPQTPNAFYREMRNAVRTMGRPDAFVQTTEEESEKTRFSDRHFVHPYFGYDNLRGSRGAAAKFSKYSFKKKDDLCVFVLGGSVAAIFAQRSGKHFVSMLNSFPHLRDRRIYVIPEARAGYKQPQQVTKLAYILSIGGKPDVVINIDGYNELALSAYNLEHGVFPAYPSLSHWGRLNQGADEAVLDLAAELLWDQKLVGWICETALGLRVQYSSVLSKIALGTINWTRTRFVETYEEYLRRVTESAKGTVRETIRGPAVEIAPEDLTELYAEIWKEASISLAAMCQVRGIHYLHFLQPTLFDEGSKPLTDEERKISSYPFSVAAVKDGYPKLRKAGAELRDQGILFYDISMLFQNIRDTVYYDACHFRGEGLDLFSEAVAKALEETLR